MNELDKYDEMAAQLLPCPIYNGVVVCHDPGTGTTIHARVCPAWRRHEIAFALRKQGEEIKRLQTLLAYTAPAVDHSCLAAATLGDHDCKRCEIDRVLEAK